MTAADIFISHGSVLILKSTSPTQYKKAEQDTNEVEKSLLSPYGFCEMQ